MLHPDSGFDKEEGDDVVDENAGNKKMLVKFYWDEKKKKMIHGGPSLMNAMKTVMRRDQRIMMYLICLLIIPINLLHGQ